MATIRCPHCGKSNPDLLDVCQFCQTPLKPDSVLRSGEKPTKKNTGELESVLPDWLKNIQQQAKDAADEESSQAAARPEAKKDEPPDLLAGLASQAGSSEEEDVPDWLASLSPPPQPKPSAPPAPVSEAGKDYLSQLNEKESKPEPVSETPPQEDTPSWMSGMREEATIPFEKDELSEWFAQASGRSEETVEPHEERSDTDWGSSFDSPSGSAEKPPAKEEEDLSWLHNLEAAAKQTGELPTSKQEMDWTAGFETPSTPMPASGPQEDLSWLDRLGGIEESAPSSPEQHAAPQSAKQDDLDWLNKFGGITDSPQPSQPVAPHAAEQSAAQPDLSWLNDLGAPAEPQPVDAAPNQPIPPQPFVSDAGADLDWLNTLGAQEPAAQPASMPEQQPAEEDLSWLNNLGKPSPPSEPAAPVTSEQDLSWLNALGGETEPLSTPPFTSEDLGTEQAALNLQNETENTEPDWLKSATEAPSMPAPGDLSMDWFSGTRESEREKTPPPVTPQAVPFNEDIFSTPSESAPLSNQEVDSLFSMEMPDWLSRPEPETAEPASRQTESAAAEGDESLAPVDLPSWVQAMRPVEAVITETTPSVADQPAETEGPLAGLHGVIPIAPVGSARRPKAVSLTLQTSDEQQASALLLEQILGSETSPRALVASTVVTSQQWLRWALSGVFLLVLSAVILLGSQIMPVASGATIPSAALSGLSNAVMSIPAGSNILVVVDYEPSLAGEMEAISGPLLNQIALLSRPNLSFVSTSPNGAVLVERLLDKTDIRNSLAQYNNLGYLPGGPAGVLGFIESPGQMIPSAGVESFSQYTALIVLTDHAESGRVWVEQRQNLREVDPAVSNQPLLVAASAQAGPLLQPYVSSQQITAMISGLSDAARYESLNNSRPGLARSYWDAFGVGLMLSVALMIIGGLWSLFAGMRERRANAEQG